MNLSFQINASFSPYQKDPKCFRMLANVLSREQSFRDGEKTISVFVAAQVMPVTQVGSICCINESDSIHTTKKGK